MIKSTMLYIIFCLIIAFTIGWVFIFKKFIYDKFIFLILYSNIIPHFCLYSILCYFPFKEQKSKIDEIKAFLRGKIFKMDT